MTVGELIDKLSQYDPELELKIEDAFGIEFHFDSLWNYDNETNELMAVEMRLENLVRKYEPNKIEP